MRRLSLVLALTAAAAACTDQPFTVDVPLRVVSISPSGGATGVARKTPDGKPAPIFVAFSEELDASTVTAKSVVLAKLDAAGKATVVETEKPAFAAKDGTFVVTVTPKA